MSPEDFEILCHMSNGGKPPDFAVRLLEDVCARTGLDWKARHVYLMSRGGKWGVTLSIDGFRAVGARSTEYAGQEGPFWVTGSDGAWTDIPPDGPIYAAKVGIKKRDGVTTWGVAKFKDYSAGPMWTKFPSTMVAKCAEMLAWRKTFPDTFGGLYGAEEMEQAGGSTRGRAPSLGTATAEVPAVGAGGGVKELYVQNLTATKNLAEVLALGKTISEDKSLGLEDNLALHALYTTQKKKFAEK